jgi:hypothetical protein
MKTIAFHDVVVNELQIVEFRKGPEKYEKE